MINHLLDEREFEEEKTSISAVSEQNSLSYRKIIEIISWEPDFTIDDDYIINKKLFVKSEQALLWKTISETHKMKEKQK